MIKLRKLTIFILYNLIVVTLFFAICEGLSSFSIVAYKISTTRPIAESVHTEYDDTMGWINLPNVYIRDMYGPGIYLKTNGQRFRNNNEFSLQTPSNKVRIICSGDSFTLGYGVDNDHPWCQQLVSINESLETVNMGQGGYGIDQAYLWYKRDGVKLNHDIQIFAFNRYDFVRMQHDEFLGYGKPFLALKDGALVTKNVPVPKPSLFKIWLNRNQDTISQLSSIRILQKLFFQRNPVGGNQDDNQTREILLKVFQDLRQMNQNKNSILVLVYLPVEQDYSDQAPDPWRQFLHGEAAKHGLLFIDLVDEFRNLPSQSIEPMFIGEEVVNFELASGHYTDEGNSYIAKALYGKLLAIPETSDKLKQKSSF